MNLVDDVLKSLTGKSEQRFPDLTIPAACFLDASLDSPGQVQLVYPYWLTSWYFPALL